MIDYNVVIVNDKSSKRSINVTAVSYIVFAWGTDCAICRRLFEAIRNDRLHQHESESVHLRRTLRCVQTVFETDDQERYSDQSRNYNSLKQSLFLQGVSTKTGLIFHRCSFV